MKIRFHKLVLSGILLGTICTGALAQAGQAPADKKQKKDKVQIVIVEKRERDRSDNRDNSDGRRSDGDTHRRKQ